MDMRVVVVVSARCAGGLLLSSYAITVQCCNSGCACSGAIFVGRGVTAEVCAIASSNVSLSRGVHMRGMQRAAVGARGVLIGSGGEAEDLQPRELCAGKACGEARLAEKLNPLLS